jgi:hypothetical protein
MTWPEIPAGAKVRSERIHVAEPHEGVTERCFAAVMRNGRSLGASDCKFHRGADVPLTR